MIETSAFEVAKKFEGIHEVPGHVDNPQIMAMLQLDSSWAGHDEVPWCSAFVNYVAFVLGLERSRSLAARSWLMVGEEVPIFLAEVGEDVVIIKRGSGSQPDASVINAPGHVGLFAGFQDDNHILILGGNQSDGVNIKAYRVDLVLGVRRLRQAA